MVSFYNVDPMQKPNNYCTYYMRALHREMVIVVQLMEFTIH